MNISYKQWDGATQSNNLAASMKNFATTQDILQTALNSSGSAIKENERVLDSVEGKYQSFRSAFEQLATGIIDSGLIKGILEFGTGLLKVANTDGVKFIATVGLIVGSLTLLSKGVKAGSALFKTMQVDIAKLIVQQQLMATGMTKSAAQQTAANALISTSNLTVASSIKAVTAAMLSNPIFMGTVAIVAIMGIIKAIDALTVSYEEQEEKINSLKQEYEDTKNKITETEEELKNIQKRIEELEGKDTLSIVEEKELEKLKTENKLLENQIKLLEKQAQLKKEDERKATLDLVNTKGTTNEDSRKAISLANNSANDKEPWYFKKIEKRS